MAKICRNNKPAELVTSPPERRLGLTCDPSGQRAVDLNPGCNPHHPEALLLGVLQQLFGKARHCRERVCVRKKDTAVRQRVARLVKMQNEKKTESSFWQIVDIDNHSTGWTSTRSNVQTQQADVPLQDGIGG